MKVSALVYYRDFTPMPMDIHPPKVVSFSHTAIGGPKTAELTLSGNRNTLINYLSKLRCPVEIINEKSDKVWWGYISEVSLKLGSVNIGVSLDTMSNRIWVSYTGTSPNAQMTAEALDQESIDEYGYKELLETNSDLSTLQAEQLRDILLSRKKYPIPTIEPIGYDKEINLTIYCKGWWETLDWQYFGQSEGLLSYANGGGGKATVGDVTESTVVGQSFQLTDSWNAVTVKLRACKSGTPIDNLVIDLCADSGADTPAGVLATVIITPGDIPSDMDWVEADFAVPFLMLAATKYWLVLSRSGAIDPVNYFWCDMDTGHAPPTGFREYDTTGAPAWVTRAKEDDGRLLYQVLDQIETTTQIEDILNTKGQFVTDVALENASGIYSCQFRDGNSTAMSELVDLMKAGSTNSYRLLSHVTSERIVRIFEEPDITSTNIIMLKNGKYTNLAGISIPASSLTAGVWVLVQELVDFEAGFMADPSHLFIEELSYSVESEEVQITPRDVPNPLDVVGGIK